jgi:lipopolysaccharide/colanic/teichoic acid biosynthesis glycosyltransferase
MSVVDRIVVDEGFRVVANSAGNRYASLKPFLEFPLALAMLLISAPIILIAMVLVKLTSKGAAIYAQERLGQGGRRITVYKIRTMYQDSERDSGPIWSPPDDPRVTSMGRPLRWAHLDELPQLVNILRGEMSLVGPRPERPEIIAKIEPELPDYRRRLLVRPGLTGLAQVQQPPDTDVGSVRRKLHLDLYYIERMSLWLDVRILLATVLYLVCIPGVTIARIFQFPGRGPHASLEAVASAVSLAGGSPVQPPCVPQRSGDYPPGYPIMDPQVISAN